MMDLSGSALRSYHIQRKVAEGGQGAVYYAAQELGPTSREVALKVIQPQFATIPSFIRRFEAEAQIVARLEHPYIVPLYDYWRDVSGAYLVMRWMPGGSLEGVLRHGPLELGTVIRVIEQVASALAYAHARGVVHRDLKPANLLRDEDGNTYLADFGIAIGNELVVGTPLSEARAFTPGYAAPEQILLAPATPQSDLYSLGVVLYELLTGRPAFPGQTVEERVRQQLEGQLPSVQSSMPQLPVTLDAVIQRATARDPLSRYADAQQLAAAVRLTLAPIALAGAANRSTEEKEHNQEEERTKESPNIHNEPPSYATRELNKWAIGVYAGIFLLIASIILFGWDQINSRVPSLTQVYFYQEGKEKLFLTETGELCEVLMQNIDQIEIPEAYFSKLDILEGTVVRVENMITDPPGHLDLPVAVRENVAKCVIGISERYREILGLPEQLGELGDLSRYNHKLRIVLPNP